MEKWCQFHLTMPWWRIKMTNFIKSWPNLLNILCDKMGTTHKHFWFTQKAWLSWGKYTWVISQFFIEHYFYLKKQLTGKLHLFEHLADVFSKMNEVSLSLQGNTAVIFVANDKIWTFKWKLEFGGDLYHELVSFPKPKDISSGLRGY